MQHQRGEVRLVGHAFAFFLIAGSLAFLLRPLPFWESLRKALPPHGRDAILVCLRVVVCLAGVMVTHRLKGKRLLAEIGLFAPPGRALCAMFLASLPMLACFAALSNFGPSVTWFGVFHRSALSAFSEEAMFRGYLFRQLYRRAGWGFAPAVFATAAPFALGHLTTVAHVSLAEVLATLAITGVGGALFAWVFVRWGDNLWAPVGLHAFMNLWWELYRVDSGAVGGLAANIARAISVVLAIVLTRRWNRSVIASKQQAAQ